MPQPATRFLFERDFGARAPSSADVPQTRHAALLAEADAAGHARGLVEGRGQAEVAQQGRLADAANRLALAAAALLGAADARAEAIEREAIEVAVALARTIAGEALAARPLAAVEEAARAAFAHLRGVPHLVVRVHEALVEETDAMLRRLARERGYEGRVVVLGETDLVPGDARIEWADGAVVRDRARIEAAVAAALADLRAPSDPADPFDPDDPVDPRSTPPT